MIDHYRFPLLLLTFLLGIYPGYSSELKSIDVSQFERETSHKSGRNSYIGIPAAGQTGTIRGDTSVCQYAKQPSILFTGKDGTPPYTFKYKLNGADRTVISAAGKDTVTVRVPTDTPGSYKFELTSVNNQDVSVKDPNVTAQVTVVPVAVVDFTFPNDEFCSGSPVTFTAQATGTGPFTYTWNFGDKNSSTQKDPTHIYTSLGCGTDSFLVSLTVTNASGCASLVKTKKIAVKRQPELSFVDLANPKRNFDNCKYTSIEHPDFSVELGNTSKSASCIKSYAVDWGDGSPVIPNATFPLKHTYTKLGGFDLVVTAVGLNSCIRSVKYLVKNATNPAGGINSPGTTTDLCAPTEELGFSISNWGKNSPGTTYTVDYGDGSNPKVFSQDDMVKSGYYLVTDPINSSSYPIPHSYNESSCPNKHFILTLTIKNVCDETPATVGNIRILKGPSVDFSISNACLNTDASFINKTDPGYDLNCSKYIDYTWEFGDGTPPETKRDSIPPNATHRYTKTGTYEITLTAENFCGKAVAKKQINIYPLPTATMTGGAAICQNEPSPVVTFTAANGMPHYTFTYRINNGQEKTVTTTSGNQAVLSVPTSAPGTFTYYLTRVQEGSPAACSQAQTDTAVFVIRPLPSATISGSNTFCMNDISPKITFSGYSGVPPYTFHYTINGGEATSISSEPGISSVMIPVPTQVAGTFTYTLTGVTDSGANSCAQSLSGSAVIIVKPTPGPILLDNYEFCNGEKTPVIHFTNSISGTNYTWTNTQFSIGLTGSGAGDIPSFIAVNATNATVTSHITVTPLLDGCKGSPQLFYMKVHPAATVDFSQTDQSVCSGEKILQVDLSSSTVNSEVSWTTTQPAGIAESIALSGTRFIAAQSYTNTTDKPVDITYMAKATLAGATVCSGKELPYKVTVFPLPRIVTDLKDTVCSGVPFMVTPKAGGGNILPTDTRYMWKVLQISSEKAITGATDQSIPQVVISENLVNTTTLPASVTYLVTPVAQACTNEPFKLTVTVNPQAIVDSIRNITLCHGEVSPEIIFSGNLSKADYKWVSDPVEIGLGSTSGNDKIASFTALNNGLIPLTARFNVQASSDIGNLVCEEKPISFTITVNPVAKVKNPGNVDVCHGKEAVIHFTAENVGGTNTYKWINENEGIGLAASGTGDIVFTPVNNATETVSSVITVTPIFTYNGISCEGKPEQFTLSVNPSVFMEQPGNLEVCHGAIVTPEIFRANVTSARYTWINDKSSIGLPGSGTGQILPFKALNTGSVPIVATITVTPGLTGCEGLPNVFTITVNPSPEITSQPASTSICLGGLQPELSVSYANGTGSPSFQWFSNSSNNTNGSIAIKGANGPKYTPPHDVPGVFYYYCVITFPSGSCNTLESEIARVEINPIPVISDYYLEIGNGEAFKVTPGAQPGEVVPAGTLYTWDQPVITPDGSVSGADGQPASQTEISQVLTNKTNQVVMVVYTVVPMAGVCIGKSFLITVKVSPPLYPNASLFPVTCFGADDGGINTDIRGGVPFRKGKAYITHWTGPNGFRSETPSVSGLQPGEYFLEIIDSLGMKVSVSYVITEPEILSISPDGQKDVTCHGANDGEIRISALGGVGGYLYEWTKNNVSFSSSEDLEKLGPGEYHVTVTDAMNCAPQELSFTIYEPPVLTVLMKSKRDVTCYGGTDGDIVVDVAGGEKIEWSPGFFDYQYEWSGPGGFSSTNKNLNEVSSGMYHLRVADKSGCTTLFSMEIKQPEPILLTEISSAISCDGADDASIRLLISGGISPYEVRWNHMASGDFLNNLGPGDYTATVTDAHGCQEVITVNIPEAPPFRVSPVIKNVTCHGMNDGSIKLNYEGPLTPVSFTWSDNSSSGTSRNNIGPGTYTVTIAGGDLCMINRTFVITEPLPIVVSADVQDADDCLVDNVGAIVLSVSGGRPPYAFSWSNGETTKDITGLQAGVYSVTVTDINGCTKNYQYVVKRPLPIDINVGVKMNFDCKTMKVKAITTARVTGGVPPYLLSWSDGKVISTDQTVMETDRNGTFYVSVTDARGCTAKQSFHPDIPDPGINAHLVDCDLHLFRFLAVVPDESDIFSYQWDFGDGISSNEKSPQHIYKNSGTHKVKLTVTNLGTSCISIYEQTVDIVPPEVSLFPDPVFCPGDSIYLFGQGAYSYKWSNGTTADSLLVVNKGKFSLIGYSKVGCTDTLRFDATHFGLRNYSIESDRETVSREENLVRFTTENIPLSDYNWNFDDGTLGQGASALHSFEVERDGWFDIRLRIVNPDGCLEEATKRIWIDLEKTPNTFTPNGDGINDIFMRNWNIQVYNRNGILMYEGRMGWDGTYSGKQVADDTYFVVVYDETPAGVRTKTSYVTVINNKAR